MFVKLVFMVSVVLLSSPGRSQENKCAPTKECSMSKLSSMGCRVDCSHPSAMDTRLDHIPENLPSDTVILILDHNEIKNISSETLCALNQLEHLSIAYNSLETFEVKCDWEMLNLVKLTLNHNFLVNVNSNTFSVFPNLQHLHLGFNNISELELKAFDGVPNMTHLHINNNRLSVADNQSVPNGVFQNLTNLIHLRIDHNLASAYRGDLVDGLLNLQELELDGPRDNSSFFPTNFSNLRSLTSLAIYGKVEILTKSIFSNLKNCPIKQLRVNGGFLNEVDPDAMAPLDDIKQLDLSDNPNLTLCQVKNVWRSLNTSASEVNLTFNRVMNMYSNQAMVPCNFTEHLRNDMKEKIRSIKIEANNLVVIDRQFEEFENLQELSLNFNRMQKIRVIQCSSKDNLKFSKHIKPPSCYACSGAEYRPPDRAMKEGYLYLPSSIRNLSMNVALNYDLMPFPKLHIIDCNELEDLQMNSNALGDFTGPIMINGSNKSFTLSLAGNYASKLKEYFLKDIPVTSLDLSDNQLGNHLFEDMDGDSFRSVPYVTHLHLGSNLIKTLPSKIFQHMEKITTLNLTNNALINTSFELPLELLHLDLTFNRYVSLSEVDMERFDNQTNLTLYFQGNPLVCSCDTLNFIKWLLSNDTIKPNYRDYRCHLENEGFITLGYYFGVFHSDMEKKCKNKAYETAIIISAVTFGLTLAVLVVLYRFRWEVKFFFTRLIYRKEWEELSQDDQVYEYDAFVAYHQDDLQWVRFQLLRYLEDTGPNPGAPTSLGSANRPLRLCVHHRDFVPGLAIEENIIESIQRSNKTIIVLSRSFVDSGWCQFELQMAKLRSFDKKKNKIVVIVLEPIPMRILSPTLRILLKKTTFIEWPFSPVHRQQFWENVRKAVIGSGRPVFCECGHAMRRGWSEHSETGDETEPVRHLFDSL